MDYSNTTFLGYQKKKKEMLNDLGRISGMCNGVNCRECPLNKLSENISCKIAELLYPEKALNTVMSYEYRVDWTKVPVDAKILVSDIEDGGWVRRHFANYSNGEVYAYADGKTSFSTDYVSSWRYARLYKDDEQ